MTLENFVKTIAALPLAAALWFLSPNAAAAQQNYIGSPVTKARLIKVLQSKKFQQSEIIEIIETSGADFELAPDIERELVAAGARPAVLKTLKNNYRYAADKAQTAIGKPKTATSGAPPAVKPPAQTAGEDFFEKGDAFFADEKWELAAAAYKQSLAAKPTYQAYLNLGRAFLKLNQPQAALENLQASLRLKPDYALTLSRIGSAQTMLGNNAEALNASTRSVLIDAECDICWNNLGVVYMNLRNLQSAADAYRRAIEINPDFYLYPLNLSGVLENLGKTAEAVESAKKAVGMKPDSDAAWATLSARYVAAKNFAEALSAAQKAVQLNPNNDANYIALGAVFVGMQNFSFAADAYEKAARLNAADPFAWFGLGISLFQNEARADDAINAFRQVVKLVPGDAASWNNLGMLYEFRKKDYAAAVENYRQASLLAPGTEVIKQNLLRAQAKLP